jgi:hypothetical protein
VLHGLVIGATTMLSLAGCTGLARNDQGRLQPQTVQGPCDVQKFFLEPLTVAHTTAAVHNTGEACTFTMLNPDLQIFPSATLVTAPAQHGQAIAGLVNGLRSPIVSYTPQRGYAGPDQFTVTIEPNDHAVAVAVMVSP